MGTEQHKGLTPALSRAVQFDGAGTSLRSSLGNLARNLFRYFSRPSVLPVLQAALTVLLLLWLLSSLWRAIWSFVPVAPPLATQSILNPVTSVRRDTTNVQVDIDALAAAQLFGQPGATVSSEDLAAGSGRSPAMSEEEAAEKLAGIEDGAPETRLPLVLRGVVASSEAGLGQAVIEQNKRQDLYQVGDELPVNGEVSLAKVLPDRVVLDNDGRFEVLKLFEDGGLSSRNESSVARREPAPARAAPAAEVQASAPEAQQGNASAIAARYRDRLYRDPQSLADVVRISPEREGDRLLGYRIAPGVASAEFAALGFKTGDVVTSVNGLSLAETANLPTLHSAMRSASSASFELQRKGETVTLTVDIGQVPSDGSR